MDISKLNVLLTGSAAGLISACSSGGEAVHSFSERFAGAAGAVAGVAALFGVALSAESIVGYTERTIEAITATTRFSAVLGISEEKLTQLQYAASATGATSDDLQGALLKQAKSLNEAQDATSNAAKAYKALGLDVNALLALSPDQQFMKIADALNQQHNATQRNADAFEIYGKGAASILPLLQQGSEGMSKLAEESNKLGVTLTSVDGEKVLAAHEALNKIEEALQGVANQFTVALAPYIDAAATKLVEFGTSGEGAGKLVVNAFEAVVKGIAYAADYVEILEAAFQMFRSMTAGVMAGTVTAIAGLGDAISYVLGFFGKSVDTSGIHALAQGLVEESNALYESAGDHMKNFADGSSSKAVESFFNGITTGADAAAKKAAAAAEGINGASAAADNSGKQAEKVAADLDKLKQQVEDFGKTKGQLEADKISKDGGSAADAAQAQTYADQLDALEQQKKAHDQLAEAAKKTYEESRTGAEKYADQLAAIDEQLKAGLIDQHTADEAREKASDDLIKSMEVKPTEAPKALTAGSKEAENFVANLEQRQKAEQQSREAIATAKEQAKYLKILADKAQQNTGDDINVVDSFGAGVA